DIDVLRRRRERVLAVLAVVLVLGVAGTTAYYILRPNPVAPKELIRISQQAAREAVGLQYTYQFAGENETEIKPEGNDTYVVIATGVAMTREGQARGFRFKCTVGRRLNGSWGPEKLELSPQ